MKLLKKLLIICIGLSACSLLQFEPKAPKPIDVPICIASPSTGTFECSERSQADGKTKQWSVPIVDTDNYMCVQPEYVEPLLRR